MTLRIESLTFGFWPGKAVLRDMSAELPPGVNVIVGPNGAGKSTLLRLLLGALRPVKGTILHQGRQVHRIKPAERARSIAYVSQRPVVAAAFSVREVVRLGRYAAGGSADTAATERAIARMDLAEQANEPYGVLSAGQQQRVALARAIAQLDRTTSGDSLTDPPRVFLLDEPFSAMDPAHVMHAARVIRELSEEGATIVMVLHDLNLARTIGHRALLLRGNGTLASRGSVEECLSPPLLEEVFGVTFRLIACDDAGVLVPSACR